MNAEAFQDALNHLDDDLLLATDRLRQRKKLSVWRIAGLAACLCLILGIGLRFAMPELALNDKADFFYSSQESAESWNIAGNAAPMETVAGMGETLLLTVTAREGNVLRCTVSEDSIFPKGTPITVKLEAVPDTDLQNPITVHFTRWEETDAGIVVYASEIG